MLVQRQTEQLVDIVKQCREMQEALPEIPVVHFKALDQHERILRIGIQSNKPEMVEKSIDDILLVASSRNQEVLSKSLYLAAYYGFVPCMMILIAKGADVNYHSSTGQTPLMKAVGSRNVDAVKLLLEKNANASVSTASGITALSIAQLVADEAILSVLRESLVPSFQMEEDCEFMAFGTYESFISFMRSTKIADIRTIFFSVDAQQRIVPLRSLPRSVSTQDDVTNILNCIVSLRNMNSCFAVRSDFGDVHDSQWKIGYCMWHDSVVHDQFQNLVNTIFPQCTLYIYSDPRTIEADVWRHLFPEYGSAFSHFAPGSTYYAEMKQNARRRRSNDDVLSPPTLEKYNKGASKRTKSFSSEPLPMSTVTN